MMFEDEMVIDEDGQKYQEISCIGCSYKRFINYDKYRAKLVEIARERGIVTRA